MKRQLFLDPFLMIKNQLVVVAVSLFVFFACDSAREEATTKLNATVSIKGTQLVIINKDSFDYANTQLKINDNYVLKGFTFESGKSYRVGMRQFEDDEGDRYDVMEKPQSLSIWCDLKDSKKGAYHAEW
ncbi:MAG: hypothetical protein CMC96_05745 [Flavobacteriales bacterium]|nr:hypothetical protein [Flavobacteriales bacterium]|tara:strand:- start:7829 stop:8215 length:387 start_codon:yes stop_codon:yes gene_type:complete